VHRLSTGTLEDFKKGLDSYIGMPSFNVRGQMEREHCNSHDSHTKFSPPNNPNLCSTPAIEWDYVVNFDPTREYPGGDGRQGNTVHFYFSDERAKLARLTESEVIALRLYRYRITIRWCARSM
jgi:hypothetical protein